MPANFSANFDSELFGLRFPGFQATQKIHAQNSRPELSAVLSNFTFWNPKFIHGDFLLTGETNKYKLQVRNGQSTVGGPKWTKMDHFGLSNAKIQFGIRSF